MALGAQIAVAGAALESAVADWDALAVRAGRPFSAPAWVRAMHRHLGRDDFSLCVALVREEGELIAVLPLEHRGSSYRVACTDISPVEPLARPGREAEAAGALAEILSELDPPPGELRLTGHEGSPDWGGLLARAWPHRRGVWSWPSAESRVPFVDLEAESFEAWLAGKSHGFRREFRRKRRRLGAAGADFRDATLATLEADVAVFLQLHLARRSQRGGSDLERPGVADMLIEVGRELLPEERFRLIVLEVDGQVAAAELLVAAGDELSAWNSGFDERFAPLWPSMQTLLKALEVAFGEGFRSMSLGPGGQAYKYRLADRDEAIRWQVLIPRGAGYPLRRLRIAPAQARRRAARTPGLRRLAEALRQGS